MNCAVWWLTTPSSVTVAVNEPSAAIGISSIAISSVKLPLGTQLTPSDRETSWISVLSGETNMRQLPSE